MQSELRIELTPVQRWTPWAVAIVSLILYLVTLNHDATFWGLVNLAKVVGWDWRPTIQSPLQFLVTLPVRYLPAGLQLQAVNVIAAVGAAGALGLLARCICLLPHDRTRDQRHLERSEYSLLSGRLAWIPPVLAAAVCGLQLSFWENAVVGTGEALDLLVFAWLVHALLRYRLDQRVGRLYLFAFVYGVGLTNNYALIPFMPLFLAALIWMRGQAFWNWRFLLRLTLCGVAGLLLYLLMPTLALLGPDSGYGWWEMVRLELANQRDHLRSFSRLIAFLLSLTSVLPVIFIGIRWPAQFGEVSPLGNMLTNFMTHLIHAVFLAACLYVSFDHFFSPRNLSGGMATFLPFYFLGALAIGYCTGYFLLLLGPDPADTPSWQRTSPLGRVSKRFGMAVVLALLIGAPAFLAYQNVSAIWANTGPALGRLTTLAAQSLPKEGAVVLSDEPFRLYALEHELRKSGLDRSKFILVDTRSVEVGGYHLHMLRQHPGVWPKVAEKIEVQDRIPQVHIIQLMLKISEQRPIYYLHPSFGYFFDSFEMLPRGIVYQLRRLGNTSLSGSVLSPAEIQQGEKFWQELRTRELDRLVREIPPPEFATPGSKMRVQTPTLVMYVGRLYSQALDYFGVALQVAGQMKAAVPYFDLALKLDPYNASAMLNRDFNQYWQAGAKEPFKISEEVIKRLAAIGGGWPGALSACGPVEEPAVCQEIARMFYSANQSRQAGQYLERVLHYQPTNTAAWTIYPSLAVNAGLPDLAVAKVAELRASPLAARLTPSQQSELNVAEAGAYAARGDVERAEKLLRAEQARSPGEVGPWRTLIEIYLSGGRLTNALALADEQLKAQPRNVETLVDAAVIRARLGRTKDAIADLDRALEIDPKDQYARLNRARFHAAIGNYDAAQKDFEELRSMRSSFGVVTAMGLADLQDRKKNPREALRLYRQLLKSLPEGAPERRQVEERIKQIAP